MGLTNAASLALVLASGCTPPPQAAGGGPKCEDGGVPPSFVEVDRDHTTDAFRLEMADALAILAQSPTEIGRLTYESIITGRTQIDTFDGLTCWDFSRVQRDLEGSVTLGPHDFARLHDADGLVAASIAAVLDGWQWGDRLYVDTSVLPEELAVTLVHEVNHVLNRSNEGYYDDPPTSIFLHEYRAIYAETMFDSTLYLETDLLSHVIELNGLDRERIAIHILENPLTPLLLPSAEAWDNRPVVVEPLDVDEECPLYRDQPNAPTGL